MLVFFVRDSRGLHVLDADDGMIFVAMIFLVIVCFLFSVGHCQTRHVAHSVRARQPTYDTR